MSEVYLNYFRSRKVLVTGGFGFIGSNLCAALINLGAEVTVIDRSIPPDTFGELAVLGSRMRVEVADIRDEDAVMCVVPGQDVIFDLAGVSGAADSNREPLKDLDNNCRGHLTILEACRTVNRHVSLVFPSSRLVYGRPQYLPVDEQHPTAPESIYAVHKLAIENYVLMYARRYGMKATVLRISNPYGPPQSLESRTYGIANQFIQTVVKGETVTLFGDGEQRRDYLYIDDLVDMLLRSARSSESANKIYNIGSGAATSLRELAEAAIAVAGRGKIERVPWPPDYHTVETGDYVSDITRAEQELGWHPTTSIHTGIERTVTLYKRRI